MPQIEVTFDIDANGIVHVSAQDKATGREQSIRIQASGGLSDADIQKMVKDAEAHAEEDRKKRELVEQKNQAESLIHGTEKTLRDLGDKVSKADRSAVESAVDDLKSALDGDDRDLIKSRSEALTQASMKIGEHLYAQSRADDDEEGDGAGRGEDDVVDADYEDVSDNNGKRSA
jgi:molecular chaperone DnaK